MSYNLRSRTKKADPKDTAAGIKILRNLCYPYMQRFVVPRQELGQIKNHILHVCSGMALVLA